MNPKQELIFLILILSVYFLIDNINIDIHDEYTRCVEEQKKECFEDGLCSIGTTLDDIKKRCCQKDKNKIHVFNSVCFDIT